MLPRKFFAFNRLIGPKIHTEEGEEVKGPHGKQLI
jgi:hypothetical protein